MLFACLLSIAVFRTNDTASKIIGILVLVTFLNERVGNYYAYTHQNSNVIYGIFNPIQLLIVAIYFNFSIDLFRKKNIGIIIGIIGCIMGFIDYYLLPDKMNNVFLLSESVIIVAMCLYSFYRMLVIDDGLRLITYPHFWFTAIFLFFWTSLFLIWGLYDFLIEKVGVSADVFQIILLTVNVITYLAFGVVFLLYNKMRVLNAK